MGNLTGKPAKFRSNREKWNFCCYGRSSCVRYRTCKQISRGCRPGLGCEKTFLQFWKTRSGTPPTKQPKIGHTKIRYFEAASRAREPAACPNSLIFAKSSSPALKNEWWVGISRRSRPKVVLKKQKRTRLCSRTVYIISGYMYIYLCG